MPLEQLHQLYTQHPEDIYFAAVVLTFILMSILCSRWKSKALACKGSAEVIKLLRDEIQIWKSSNTLTAAERNAERKARVDELEAHARNWRRMSDRLLRDGKNLPEESDFSDEALRRIGTFATGESDAGDWLDGLANEIGVEDKSTYTELAEAIIKARKA